MVPSNYFVTTQLQVWFFCCRVSDFFWAVTCFLSIGIFLFFHAIRVCCDCFRLRHGNHLNFVSGWPHRTLDTKRTGHIGPGHIGPRTLRVMDTQDPSNEILAT